VDGATMKADADGDAMIQQVTNAMKKAPLIKIMVIWDYWVDLRRM
jgi:hypothetical protein